MKKSTKNLLLGGALAVGAFYLAKSVLGQKGEPTILDQFSAIPPVQSQAALSGEFQRATGAAIQKEKITRKEASDLEASFKRIVSGTASPSEGVSFINKAVSSGVRLPRTSKTLSDWIPSGTFEFISTGKKLGKSRLVEIGTREGGRTKRLISVSSKG
jgi:hypothetical protein